MRLLDRSISRVFEVDPVGHTVDQYKGTYSQYLEVSEREKLALGKVRNRRLAEIDRLQSQADSFRGKTEKMARRAKVFDRRIARMKSDVPQIARDAKSIAVKIPPAPRSGRVVLEVESLNKSYGANRVLKDLRFHLERGERLAVIGANGAGKTTLLKIISGVIEADSGHVDLGYNVVPGYYSQELEDELADVSPFEQVRRSSSAARQKFVPFWLNSCCGGPCVSTGKHAFGWREGPAGAGETHVDGLQSVHPRRTDEQPGQNVEATSARIVAGIRGSMIAVSHDREFVEA